MPKEPTNEKTAVGYIRIAKIGQGHTSGKNAEDRQRAALHAKATELGVHYKSEYIDHVGKGKPKAHPSLSMLFYVPT